MHNPGISAEQRATSGNVSPESVRSRRELADALSALRVSVGLTVREAADRAGALQGTVAGWFSGQHVPTLANRGMFDDLLAALGVADPAERARWHEAADRARVAPGRRGSATRAPYKGLDCFQPGDADLFFGREELTAATLARVAALRSSTGPRLLFVLGPSGSGKSSLVRAGLFPAVDRGEGDFEGCAAALTVPGSNPSAAFAQALATAGPGAGGTVVFIDQFEEAWTQCADPAARGRFLEALAQPPQGTVVVAALRADFYGQASREPALLPALRATPVLVGPLSEAELAQAITAPAASVGYTVDSQLLRVLLRELAPRDTRAPHDGGALPLLSHALLATWELSRRKQMTVADYQATGGIDGAVQQSAERVFTGLTDPQREVARRCFQRLVTVDGPAETRRRVPLRELLDTDAEADIRQVLEEFADNRLLTTDAEHVEITHEALLTAWPRLREWVDGSRTSLVAHRSLTNAARTWAENDREDGSLLGAARLEVYQQWAADDDNSLRLNNLEREYLAASAAHQEQVKAAARRRAAERRRVTVALAVLTVVSLVLTAVAFTAFRSAQSERSRAELARDQALSRQVAGEAAALRRTAPDLSAQLAAVAYRINPTLEARSALLDATATPTPLRVLGPAGPTRSAISPDGATAATASSDGVVRLYRTEGLGTAPTPVGELRPAPGDGPARLVEFLPGGTALLAGGPGGLSLWDVADPGAPTRLAGLDLGAEAAQAVAVSPDGRLAAAYTEDGAVLLWDVADPRQVRPLPALPAVAAPVQPVGTVAFSPDGATLAVGGDPGFAHLWDIRDPAAPRRAADLPLTTPTTAALAVTFSPDGATLVAGTTNSEVQRWALAPHDPQPQPLAPLTGFTSYVNDVAYNADGSLLAAGSSDQTLRLWNVGDPRQPAAQAAVWMTPAIVTSVDFTPGAPQVAAAGDDGGLRVWQLPGPVVEGPTGKLVQTWTDRSRRLTIATAGRGDRGIHLYDTTDPGRPRLLSRIGLPEGSTFSAVATITADGRAIAAGTAQGGLHLIDITDPARPVVHGPFGNTGYIMSNINTSPDGALAFVSNTTETSVAVWDIRDTAAPRLLRTLDAGGLPILGAATGDNRRYYVGTTSGTVKAFDITDPADITPLADVDAFDVTAAAVAVSPDDRLLATASSDREVQLWDISHPAAPARLAELSGPRSAAYSMKFSPDGRQLAAGTGDGLLWLWDIAEPAAPRQFAALTAYGSRVQDVAYLGDGGRVVGVGDSNNLRLWHTDPRTALEVVCARRGSPLTSEEWDQYLPGVPPTDPCPQEG